MTHIQDVIAYAKRFARSAKEDGWIRDGSALHVAIVGAEKELAAKDARIAAMQPVVDAVEKLCKSYQDPDDYVYGDHEIDNNLTLDQERAQNVALGELLIVASKAFAAALHAAKADGKVATK